MENPVRFLRITGLIEAISYMLLVGVAMPLKYIWQMPQAVRVIGMIHGILFIIFCIALVRATIAAKWSLGRPTLIFIASLLPFGPFVMNPGMRAYESEFEKRR